MISISPQEFQAVAGQLHRLCGIVLPPRKDYLICQRLGPVLSDFAIPDWSRLVAALVDHPRGALATAVVHAITTHETSFFRDGHPFAALAEHVLPELAELVLARKSRVYTRRGAQVSIWSAATSSGQEAYSLSILIDELVADYRPPIIAQDFLVLGTDISPLVLSQAITGVYSDHEMARGLCDRRRTAYFEEIEPGRWQINDRLRSMVQYQASSLIEPFSHLGGFDLILCRNVLIYFDEETRANLVARLAAKLSYGGYLLLGATESLLPVPIGFEAVRYGQSMFYRRVEP